MQKKTIIDSIGYLNCLFPSSLKEIDYEVMVNVWLNYFKDIEDNVLKTVVGNFRGDYFPSAPQLMKEVEKYINPHKTKLNAEEEFDKFRTALRKYGCYRENEIYNSLDPYTRVIAKRIGAYRLGMSTLEQIPFIKKEFVSEFKGSLDRYDEYIDESKQIDTIDRVKYLVENLKCID